jgi:predicted dehydrogenase
MAYSLISFPAVLYHHCLRRCTHAPGAGRRCCSPARQRPAPLPAGHATPAEEFVHHLETGEPLHPTLQLGHNLETMAILDAGIRSAASGMQVPVADDVWCVG